MNNTRKKTGPSYPGRPNRNLHSMNVALKNTMFKSLFTAKPSNYGKPVVQETCMLG
jgi:hypothetical protein